MKKLLLLAPLFLLAACSEYGKKVKEGSVEIYYKSDITKEQAKRTAELFDFDHVSAITETREAPGMFRLLEAIERHGPVDYRQAARLAGLSVNTVKNAGYLQALVAQGAIFVTGWRRSRNGPPRPIYEFGTGRSLPPPDPLSPAEKSRRHRKRKLAANGAKSLASQLRLASDRQR